MQARTSKQPRSPRPVLEDVTVVVPTLGRELIGGCLRSIGDGSHWPAALVVVDQSDGRHVEPLAVELRARGMQVEHVLSDQSGCAAATNRGLEAVRTDIIAITHDDCLVAEDWLRTLADCVRKYPHAVVTGRVDARGAGIVPSTNSSEHAAAHRRPQVGVDPLFPNNMGVHVAVVARVGPFNEDPRVRFAEDNEWGYRALRAHVAILYEPNVRVQHVAWRDAAARAETYRGYARSQGAFYGIHIRRWDLFLLARAAYDAIRGPWLLARGIVAGDDELVTIGRAHCSQLLSGVLAGLLGKSLPAKLVLHRGDARTPPPSNKRSPAG